jgi:hypothetical protein
MSISPATARRFAKRILRENKKRSYRRIVREDFPTRRADGNYVVNFGTLNRIANERGNWLPKDKEILIALGLKKQSRPRIKVVDLFDMKDSDILDALRNRKPFQPTMTQKQLREFVRACKGARS